MKSEWSLGFYFFVSRAQIFHSRFGVLVGGAGLLSLMSAFFSSSYFVPLIILEQKSSSHWIPALI